MQARSSSGRGWSQIWHIVRVQRAAPSSAANNGTILAGHDAIIESGPVTIGAGGLYQADPAGGTANGSSLSARTVTIQESQAGGFPGAMELTGAMSLTTAQNLTLLGPVASRNRSETPPILSVREDSRVVVGANVVMGVRRVFPTPRSGRWN